MSLNGTQTTVREREELYNLIISQLYYDGYQSIANQLFQILNINSNCPPSNKLQHLVQVGLKQENVSREDSYSNLPTLPGIDLDFENESTITQAPLPCTYETVYVTSHKGPCRAGAFTPDGQFVATGSGDASIKILDVEKMIAKSIGVPDDTSSTSTSATSGSATATAQQQNEAHHPVIRTLYDHQEEVTCLQFHPQEQILCSGSQDLTIKLYDFAKPSVKRAHKTIQETKPIRYMCFHPTGDYLLVGTQEPILRLYDVNTSQCFVSNMPNDHHRDSITMCNYTPTGNMYVSCSKDGDIKIWDGVSSRCINTFPKAHEGHQVTSVVFSKNGKYVLSSGKDSLVKLWELSMSRCLIAYTGAGGTGKQVHRGQAVFNHTEDFVIFADEKSTSLCTWDSRNAERQKLLSLGHNNAIRFLQHSPCSPAFLTCSDDFRARFWYKKPDPV